MFHLFYRIFLESVLANETIAKEDIIAIESIRQKYRIPLTDHLSILSEIEDFEILNVALAAVVHP